MNVWDTAGQERFDAITPIYYRNADIVFVVYDLTNKKTIQKAKYWINEVFSKNKKTILFLVGNKCDLQHESEFFDEEILKFNLKNFIK